MSGRPLHPMEQAFWLLDRATSFNGVNTAQLRGPITAAHVRQALDHVQRRHPLLRLAIAGTPPALVAAAGPIPLRIAERHGPLSWREVEREEINQRYAEGEPLCRAVWLGGDGEGELVISHQHVIADAHSAVLMMRELVTALGALVAGEALASERPLALCPALPPLLRATLGRWSYFWAMTWFFFRHLFTRLLRRPRQLPLDRVADFAERRIGVIHAELGEDETAALTASCHAEATTVQGAVGAALVLAAAELLGLDRPAWLGCFSAVSLRDLIGIDLDMGLYASQVTTNHRVSRDTPRWALAREIRDDLARILARGEQFVTIPLIGMFVPRGADPAPALARRFDLASPATVGLTNIGRVELPRQVGAVELAGFDIAVAPSVVAATVACVSTLHGRLSLNLVYVEPLFAAARAQELIDAVLRHLRVERPTDVA